MFSEGQQILKNSLLICWALTFVISGLIRKTDDLLIEAG